MTQHTVHVRAARMRDLPGLCALRYLNHPAMHRDRIQHADDHTQQYYVAERDGQIVGFGVLLLERPSEWTDTLDTFPALIDLFVDAAYRSQGIGALLIHHMEAVACQHEKSTLSLSVERATNPRAYALYERLGYHAVQTQPYRNAWRFVDSDGTPHAGEEWVIDMTKSLLAEPRESALDHADGSATTDSSAFGGTAKRIDNE